jgi:hypothetical protein
MWCIFFFSRDETEEERKKKKKKKKKEKKTLKAPNTYLLSKRSMQREREIGINIYFRL